MSDKRMHDDEIDPDVPLVRRLLAAQCPEWADLPLETLAAKAKSWGDDGLELQSSVRLGHLADLRDARHLRIALAAVIEDEHGRLSYWGLRHPPGKPDFHHPNGFALQVARL